LDKSFAGQINVCKSLQMQKLRWLLNSNQKFPTSDKVLSFFLDTKVSNLVQIEVGNLHILFFLTCEAFFGKGGAITRTKCTALEALLLAGQTPGILLLTGYRAIMRALCFAITIYAFYTLSLNLI